MFSCQNRTPFFTKNEITNYLFRFVQLFFDKLERLRITQKLWSNPNYFMKFFFSFLGAVVSVGADKGRAAFINNRGIHSLCEVISKQIFQYEDATDLMLSLLSVRGHLCWSYHSAFDDFNSLMGKLCTDFANSQVVLLLCCL